MRSTFYGFEIAKSGLFVSQRQLDITSHNISNVDTKGYSRQRLSTEAIPPPNMQGFFLNSDKGSSGRGVNTICIEQIRNPFLDKQYRNEFSKAAYYNTLETEFYNIEQLFNAEITGNSSALDSSISGTFQDFYNTLFLFQENVSSLDVRMALKVAAEKVTDTINHNANRLVEQYKNIDETIVAGVQDINTILDQIVDLNKQIFGYELSGAKANDLRDSRNLLLDELSGYMKIEYKENADNQLIVTLGGRELINHTKTDKLKAVADQVDAFSPLSFVHRVRWESDSALITFGNGDGAMGALFKSRDGNTSTQQGIPYVMSQLDELARKMVAEMNFLHVQGYSIPHSTNSNTSVNGLNFFNNGTANWRIVSNSPDTVEYSTDGGATWTGPLDIHDTANINTIFGSVNARNFKVDQDIIDSVWNIAGSDAVVSDQMGNNKMASKLVGLVNRKDSNGNNDNFNAYYKGIITSVGVEMKQITSMAANQGVVIGQIDKQRQSVMGVSLDEEMTNVIRFGHSYNAASRVITAIDEELDMLINRMGLVGRG